MSEKSRILEELESKPFSFKGWIKEHMVGILGTIIFHMVLLIIFLILKIQSFKDIRDLSIIMDFTEQPEEVIQEEEEQVEQELSDEEFIEQMLQQELNISNRASNVSQNMRDEISTEKFVDEFMKELDENRSEEYLRRQEELQKMLENDELIPVNEDDTKEKEDDPFTGPTNISYEFLEPPYDRSSLNLPVPVYKCQGSGKVEVEVNVSRIGTVSNPRTKVINASHDPECLAEVAERYALQSIFMGSTSAPSNHKAKITYTFIAQ